MIWMHSQGWGCLHSPKITLSFIYLLVLYFRGWCFAWWVRHRLGRVLHLGMHALNYNFLLISTLERTCDGPFTWVPAMQVGEPD